MFSKYSKAFGFSALILVTTACGAGNHENPGANVKSVADSNNRVFGLRQTSVDVTRENATFEFRLCRTNESKIISREALGNSDTCINPFQTSDGAPLVVSSKIFADAESAEAYLRRIGYAKGAAATLAAGAATITALVYVPVIAAPAAAIGEFVGETFVFPFLGGSAGGVGGAFMAVAAGDSAMVAGAGYLGFHVYGAADREMARDVPEIVGNFYSAKTVRDVKPLLLNFAKTLNLNVDSRVNGF